VAAVAPEAPPRRATYDVVSAATTSRADEPRRLSSALQRVDTSDLCAKALNKLGQGHAMLELNEVVGHDADFWVKGAFSVRGKKITV